MKTPSILNWLEKPVNLWLTIATYVILVGLFVQLIFLPHIMPSIHYGDGMLRGHDAKKFDWIARDQADLIESQGWSEWSPTPQGQLVSGVLSLVYVLIAPKPWAALPVNAALHATAAVSIFLVLRKISNNPRIALIAAFPFTFYPSNLLWNTQFHNENYSVPGFALVLLGWTLLIFPIQDNYSKKTITYFFGLGAIFVGSLMVALVRSDVFAGFMLIFGLITIGGSVYWAFQNTSVRNRVIRIIFILLALASIYLVHKILTTEDRQVEAIELAEQSKSETSDSASSKNTRIKWDTTPWLPESIDYQLKTIAFFRSKFVHAWSDGGSAIDLDVTFNKASDLFRYIPRAAQIGFLAPFPNMWFREGGRNTSGLTITMSSIETAFSYIFLLGLSILIYQHRRQPVIWMILIACSGLLVAYGLTIPNVGAIYRFRYPFFMPLVSLGFLGWLEVWKDYKESRYHSKEGQ